MLTLSFPGHNFYILEWIAFIPLLWVIYNNPTLKSYLLTILFGNLAISMGLYWIGHWTEKVVNIPFLLSQIVNIVYAFCMSQVFGLITLLFKLLKKYGFISDLVLFPLLGVAVFSLFPMLFYFKLGDAQSYFLPAIQAIEYTGVYGLDFMILLIN
jgi:apolipoprotein N-acyltransferase